MTFVVMRYPCLMEDEGRTFLERVCATREEAEKYIVKLTEPHTYFYPSDYYILEEPHR